MLDENLIVHLVDRKVVTDTFRRLKPAKKERLYRVALQLFGDYGFDGLSVEQYCAEAQISKGSFFLYFPSKTHLLEFCVLTFDDQIAVWIDRIARAETKVLARDRLKALYDAVVVSSNLGPEEERFYLFITRAAEHSAVVVEGVDVSRHLHGYVRSIVARGEQTGEIRGDIDVALTGEIIGIIMGAMLSRRFLDHRVSRRLAGGLFISVLFDGIKP